MHTPGPWHINGMDSIVSVRGNCTVAKVWRGGEDAALIAAAPDLLAVLSTILDVWDEHKIIGPTMYHDARAAIAKAEGR